ncbi:MAG: DUF188 domain-containing protein [Spirochaetales bacterium]|nr:DUF188 domain-containing protein [Spirochaetales bacterium]
MIATVFVADRKLPFSESEYVFQVQVPPGEGAADDYITEHAEKGDLAITRDIPLAASLVKKGLFVLDDRGGTFTTENIGERLSLRNAMMEFREAGLQYEKNSIHGKREIQAFANAFDREIQHRQRQE